MHYFYSIVDYFDLHSGYSVLFSIVAMFLSIIPYVVHKFNRRFHLKLNPLAYRIMNCDCDKSQHTLALQVAITNLSEMPCTITEMYVNVNEKKKYFSHASEMIYIIEQKECEIGRYASLPLPQNLDPHRSICGCFIAPEFEFSESELKNSATVIEIVCGKKRKKLPVDFSNLRSPLLL